MRSLFRAIHALETEEELESFLRDLCTLSELEAMAHRWAVAQLLEQGLPYLEIARRTGASTTTVTRVAHWLRHGEGGYRAAFARAAS
jgi:TrpR-related protein YerC/YecD